MASALESQPEPLVLSEVLLPPWLSAPAVNSRTAIPCPEAAPEPAPLAALEKTLLSAVPSVAVATARLPKAVVFSVPLNTCRLALVWLPVSGTVYVGSVDPS